MEDPNEVSLKIFSEVNLRWADLSGADLSGANLSGADLGEANLRWADLSGADLSGTNLSGANLSGADLSEANLSGANLRRTNLSEANLSGADLSGKDLRKANLTRADLQATRLIDAVLNGAILNEACLWAAQCAGWSIKGIICKAVYWDKEWKKRDPYEAGVFEKLFSEKARVYIKYKGGIEPLEIATLPALIQHLQDKAPHCNLRFHSIEDASEGAIVELVIDNSDEISADNLNKDVQIIGTTNFKCLWRQNFPASHSFTVTI